MRGSRRLLFHTSQSVQILLRAKPPLVVFDGATFYRSHQASEVSENPPLFKDCSFVLDSLPNPPQYWAVVGPAYSGKTTFLQCLQGHHFCVPPTARSYPVAQDLSKTEHYRSILVPSRDIKYVGFDDRKAGAGSSSDNGYLSARYESRRDETDFLLRDYLQGWTNLNPSAEELRQKKKRPFQAQFSFAVDHLGLENLLDLPVSNLSNGQTRRARIAKAVMQLPVLLLLDEPFLGLDPRTAEIVSLKLKDIARRRRPRLLLAIGDQTPVPKWITHVLYLSLEHAIIAQGKKKLVYQELKKMGKMFNIGDNFGKRPKRLELPKTQTQIRMIEPDEADPGDEQITQNQNTTANSGGCHLVTTYPKWFEEDEISVRPRSPKQCEESVVEMRGVQVRYGNRAVLGDWQQDVDGSLKPGLWIDIKRGDRLGLFGPNGSGKTTLLSLISSDHPQTYALPVKIFGRSRLPTTSQPGLSIFDLQSRIGQSSPEIHHFFPKHFSARQCLESAWADTFLSKPSLQFEDDLLVDSFLRWFQRELDPAIDGQPDPNDNVIPRAASHKWKYDSRSYRSYQESDIEWADYTHFRDTSLATQRILLFLRAIIKSPDIVILDEAFSGMDERTRIKCMMFLRHGQTRWLRTTTHSITIKDKTKHTSFAESAKLLTMQGKLGQVLFRGLDQKQALIVVSHRKEEVPPMVDKWIFLPESGDGTTVRFGNTEQQNWWNEMWAI